MSTTTQFGAPWGTALRLATSFAAVILLAMPVIAFFAEGRSDPIVVSTMVVLPLLVLGIGSLFMIRSYEIEGRTLVAQRLLWRSSIPLDGLQSAEPDPEAMKYSLRIFGNGGLFVFAGRFRSKKLGDYRAWATDPGRAVVLRWENHTWVVTPDRPQEFADALQRFIGG